MNLSEIQAINLINQVNTKDLQQANSKGLINSKEKIASANNDKNDTSTFKEVLEVKKNEIIELSDDATNITNDLEESLDDLTLDEVIDCLSRLVQMLVQEMPQNDGEQIKESLGVEPVELDLNKEVIAILSDMLNENFSKEIVSKSEVMLMGEGVESKEITNVINNLLEALKDDNIKNTVDETSLKSLEGLLKKLGSEDGKIELPIIKEAIKQVENLRVEKKENSAEKIDLGIIKVVEVKTTNKEANANTSADKESTNKELTNKELTNKESTTKELNAKEIGTSKSEIKETISKEEKVLKSILGEDDENKVNKFSLFTDRTMTTKTEAVLEAPVINKTTMVEDVIKSVKYMETNSLKELTVKINPKELGEIAIKLIQEEGVMKASIKANNKDTFSLLSQNINDIKKYLGDQNIKISQVNIELYQEDTTFFKEGEFNNNFFNEERERNNKSRNKGDFVLEEDDLEQNVTMEDLSSISMLV